METPNRHGSSGKHTDGSEVWKPLYNFPHWQVSNLGRFRKTFIPKLSVDSVGYNRLHLSNKNKQRVVAAHRAVWEAFYGRIPPNLMINHKNGNKLDNRIENLELVTNRQNIEHYKQNLLTYRGEKVSSAKLTEKQVLNIRERYKNGVSPTFLAREFNLSRSTVTRILNRTNWRHI